MRSVLESAYWADPEFIVKYNIIDFIIHVISSGLKLNHHIPVLADIICNTPKLGTPIKL
jgi:hypothetical protein